MQQETKPQSVTVQQYSLADALVSVETYVKQGYKVDVETNGTYPMAVGSLLIFTMVLDQPEAEVVAEVTQEPTTETQSSQEVLKDLSPVVKTKQKRNV